MIAAGLIGIPFQHRVMGDLHPTHLDAVVQDVTDALAYVRAHAADLHAGKRAQDQFLDQCFFGGAFMSSIVGSGMDATSFA